MPPDARPWRYFGSREVREARAFAASGGIAIHLNFRRLRGLPTCHMLAPDEPSLLEAGAAVGMPPERLHRSRTLHFDLVGEPLARALARCANAPG
jgi:hypothetical protein